MTTPRQDPVEIKPLYLCNSNNNDNTDTRTRSHKHSQPGRGGGGGGERAQKLNFARIVV